jgi:hypothetical protein
VLLAIVLLVVTATPAMAKIAPDSECGYLANDTYCTEYNQNDVGTTAISIVVKIPPGGDALEVDGTLVAPTGSGCEGICLYQVVQLCGTISGRTFCHSFGGTGGYVTQSYRIACSDGDHTVSGQMTWRIWNRARTSYQQGVYGTKNLTYRC